MIVHEMKGTMLSIQCLLCIVIYGWLRSLWSGERKKGIDKKKKGRGVKAERRSCVNMRFCCGGMDTFEGLDIYKLGRAGMFGPAPIYNLNMTILERVENRNTYIQVLRLSSRLLSKPAEHLTTDLSGDLYFVFLFSQQ